MVVLKIQKENRVINIMYIVLVLALIFRAFYLVYFDVKAETLYWLTILSLAGPIAFFVNFFVRKISTYELNEKATFGSKIAVLKNTYDYATFLIVAAMWVLYRNPFLNSDKTLALDVDIAASVIIILHFFIGFFVHKTIAVLLKEGGYKKIGSA